MIVVDSRFNEQQSCVRKFHIVKKIVDINTSDHLHPLEALFSDPKLEKIVSRSSSGSAKVCFGMISFYIIKIARMLSQCWFVGHGRFG